MKTKITTKNMESIEEIANNIRETKDLTKILSDYFNCLDHIKVEKENQMACEWYALKHNFEEYRTLVNAIIESLKKAETKMNSIIDNFEIEK